MKLFSYFLFFLFSFYSCHKIELANGANQAYLSDTAWYPITPGKFIEYKVDTILYTKATIDTTVKVDTITNFILEAYGEKISEFGDSNQYKVVLYQRKNRLLPLNYYRTWSIRRSNSNIIKTEDELTFVKMILPVNSQYKWDGNNLINVSTSELFFYRDWVYTYKGINEPFIVMNRTFDTTSTILHIDDKNQIEWRYSFEVYAKGIGMIYSERRMVYKQDPNRNWDDPENGYIIRKSIVDWN